MKQVLRGDTMTQLSAFTPEEADIIISLPYRVGINVSHVEDEESEVDDEREMSALESCFKEIVKLHKDSEFNREVAEEILRRKSLWSKWSQGTFNVVPDCERVVRLLKPILSQDELKSYKKMVMEVATSVAQAYGEFGDTQEDKGFFGKIMKKIVGGFANDSSGHPMNVSAAESDAISRIREALKKVE